MTEAGKNGNGMGFKLALVLVSCIVTIGMGVLGYVSGQTAITHSEVEAMAIQHVRDISTMSERISQAEVYQREVLRRLERIESKLEGNK